MPSPKPKGSGGARIGSMSTTSNNVTEATVVKKIKKYLEGRGGVVFKFHGGMYQQPGIPDLVYHEFGKTVYFEAKRPKGSYGVTELQKATMEKLSDQGIPCFVVRSVDDVKRSLEEIGIGVD